MAKRNSNRFIDQATLQALVRYGPELRGLRALAQQAQSDYQTQLGQAAGQRVATVQAIKQAKPDIRSAYGEALQSQATNRGIIDQDLAKLGPVQSGTSQAIQQAIALERQTAHDQAVNARANALTDLSQQQQRAVSGEQYARRQAGDTLAGSLDKVSQQALGVLNEQGAFTAATAGDLQQAAHELGAKIRIANANNRRAVKVAALGAQSRLDAASIAAQSRQSVARLQARQRAAEAAGRNATAIKEAEIRAASGGSGGSGSSAKNVRSVTAHGSLAGNVQNLIGVAKRLGGEKVSRQAMTTLMLQGQPAAVDKDGNKLPAIKPATKDQLATNIALDLLYKGQLTRDTLGQLRRQKYSDDILKYPVAPKPGTRGARQQRGARDAGGVLGLLAHLLG